MCACYQGPKDGAGSPGSRVPGSYELLCGCWELNFCKISQCSSSLSHLPSLISKQS